MKYRNTLWSLCIFNVFAAIAVHTLMLAAVSYGKTIVISRFHGLDVNGVVQIKEPVPPLYGADSGYKAAIPDHLTYGIFENARAVSFGAAIVFGVNALLLGLLALRCSEAETTCSLPQHDELAR